MTKTEPGQIWSSGNRTEFYVDDVREVDGERWIYYTNTFTQQTYSCLEPAFQARFQQVLNKG
jgi:hypothetical protein